MREAFNGVFKERGIIGFLVEGGAGGHEGGIDLKKAGVGETVAGVAVLGVGAAEVEVELAY